MRLRTKVRAAAGIVLLAAATGPTATHAATSRHATASGKASSSSTSSGSGGTVVIATRAGMPANELLANQMAAARGWDTTQQRCLDDLWDEESAGTWSPTVTNPTSGAYGIPQALPGDKMADPSQGGGPDWQTSPATQIRWGLTYIGGRYDTPCGAWQFETSHVPNWY